MRTGALLCGLIAGLFALVVPLGIGSQQSAEFVELLASTPDQRLGWTIAWHAPAGTALVAALVVLFAPGPGGLLLLAAAAGWLLISVINPIFFGYLVLAPAGIAFMGALLALLAGELAARDRRAAERSEEQREEEYAREAIEREVALSVDPLLATREQEPARPEVEITLSLEDVIPTAADTRVISPDDEEGMWPGPAERRDSERPSPKKPIFSRPVPVRRPRAANESRPRRENRLFGLFVTLNAVAVVGLAIAVGYLLIRSPAQTSAAPAAAEAQVAATSQDTAPARAYVDPFAYCGAVGTIDHVDTRYAGPSFTEDIAEALGVPPQSSPDRIRWRCLDGAVYACSAFNWPDCDTTPTAGEMADYCRRNPDAAHLMAPNGTWSCEQGRPKLPPDASWPVDARGFLPSAWIKLVAPAGAP